MIKQSTRICLPITVIILLLCALLGFVASFVLTYDKIALLKDPETAISCNINPIISCTSAMSSAPSEILGIPNSLFGLIAYTALIAVTALLLLGNKLNAATWKIILAVGVLGTLFVHYLIIQSLFFLHIICPWCFALWIATPIMLACLVRLFSKTDHATRLSGRKASMLVMINTYTTPALVLWYTSLAVAILLLFWDFWASLLA